MDAGHDAQQDVAPTTARRHSDLAYYTDVFCRDVLIDVLVCLAVHLAMPSPLHLFLMNTYCASALFYKVKLHEHSPLRAYVPVFHGDRDTKDGGHRLTPLDLVHAASCVVMLSVSVLYVLYERRALAFSYVMLLIGLKGLYTANTTSMPNRYGTIAYDHAVDAIEKFIKGTGVATAPNNTAV